jgi:transcriptional regulator with XRE-family HTH domain
VIKLCERIKILRKTLKLTQQAFAESLGVSRDTIANVEGGRIEIKDIFILSICREFDVNENWLRTGEGEMFIELSRDEQIAEFVGRTLSTESESFKKRFIAMLAKLDESDWETLEKIALELTQKKD